MTAAAPRLDARLVVRLERLARSSASVADIRRSLVELAYRIDVPPPSYEHVRRLVRKCRDRRPPPRVSETALQVAAGSRTPSALMQVIVDTDGDRRPLGG